MTGMRSRRISSTSRKPRVVMRPVLAPFCSRMVLVATVVAWTTEATSPGAAPQSASAAATPSAIPRL